MADSLEEEDQEDQEAHSSATPAEEVEVSLEPLALLEVEAYQISLYKEVIFFIKKISKL